MCGNIFLHDKAMVCQIPYNKAISMYSYFMDFDSYYIRKQTERNFILNLKTTLIFYRSLQDAYYCIGTKLDDCSADVHLIRDVVLSGSRYICNANSVGMWNLGLS